MNKDLASKIDPFVLSEGFNKRPKKSTETNLKYKSQKTDPFAQNEGDGKSTITLDSLSVNGSVKKSKKKDRLKRSFLYVGDGTIDAE
jgi:hypothetical protein